MGKINGFLEFDRRDNETLSVQKRVTNFDEFHPMLNETERRKQGARCMNCGVPFCQSAIELKGMVTGCPLHNLIPEWNDAVYHGNFAHAASRLMKTASFPEFTGRVCPALCEKACLCGRDGNPVTVRENELFIIEKAFEMGLAPRVPAVRSDKRIAVIGSGPSGLAVADLLNRRGHNVTVYEREDRIGGLLMYGIPNMKLDKRIVKRRVNLMKAEGVQFILNADVGKNLSADELLFEYDAIALCCGAKEARSIPAWKEEISGVHFAVDFLRSTTKSLLDSELQDEHYISAKDKHVVIVGGGDTGNDCVGSCIRHGCKSVTQIEMMPCPSVERSVNNPWPEWPKVLKTDYGQQEAIQIFGHDPRVYETTIKELKSENGHLKSVVTVKIEFKQIDGARRMVEIPGTEAELPAELLLIAAGFTGCESYVSDAFQLSRTLRGTIATTEGHCATGIPRVFAAGDMRRGQSLVVWAIAEGRACAREIDEALMGYTNLPK